MSLSYINIKSILLTIFVCMLPTIANTAEYQIGISRDIKLIEKETYQYYMREYKDPFIFYIKTDRLSNKRDAVADLFAMRALAHVTKRQFKDFKVMFKGDKRVPEDVLKEYFFNLAGKLNADSIEIYRRYDMKTKAERRAVFTFNNVQGSYEYVVVQRLPHNKFTLVVPKLDRDFQEAYAHINK